MSGAATASIAGPCGVAFVVDPTDVIATSGPARWAMAELENALTAKEAPIIRSENVEGAPAGWLSLLVAGADSAIAEHALTAAGQEGFNGQEALALVPFAGTALLVAGGDARGLVYALTELADRVRHSADWRAALAIDTPVVEHPAAKLRSIARAFMSEEGDKGWFHDREMWGEYLSMLVTQRFNRFSMTLGMQYNYPYHNAWIADVYMYFPYPFLIDVPDYNIRVEGLSTQEREKNLRTLQFISTEAARRGLEFQLAIWTHGYDFDDTPNASYQVRGITRENHAAYCRDALHKLLIACPAITGLTLRVHVESGIAEGDYEFWRTVFEGIVAAGRRIEIDLHAKGVDPEIIEIALATGMPVNISPKYMGEHMGPPYHQASIRDWEMPPDEAVGSMFTFSEGSRRFLRYSYGDLLKEDRPYGVFFRIWAGTQRVLLWGDPAMAAGYGRSSTFAGSLGVELCEPLFFEGRGGQARVGSRFNYADATLRPRYDWEKYLYNYRIWGRLNYNPQTPPTAGDDISMPPAVRPPASSSWRWPTPAGFCHWSRWVTPRLPPTTITGPSCQRTCRSCMRRAVGRTGMTSRSRRGSGPRAPSIHSCFSVAQSWWSCWSKIATSPSTHRSMWRNGCCGSPSRPGPICWRPGRPVH